MDNHNNIPNIGGNYSGGMAIRTYPPCYKSSSVIAWKESHNGTNLNAEDENYDRMAKKVVDLMFSRNIERVHLVAKCAGAAVVMKILQMSDNGLLTRDGKQMVIENLILCVPALEEPERLLPYTMPMFFAWQDEDETRFDWGMCRDDCVRYATTFDGIDGKRCKSYPGREHEIPVGIFSEPGVFVARLV
jgi:hypothetical protein